MDSHFQEKGFLILQKSLRTPYFQLAWEEALALKMQEFNLGYGVRIWKNHHTIVLGISEKESITIKKNILDEFQQIIFQNPKILKNPKFQNSILNQSSFWLIARRQSGGGTVSQTYTGNTNYSLFIDTSQIPELYPVRKSYDILLNIVRDALLELGVQSEIVGKSDISILNHGVWKKISGNAQFRKKNIIVLHGTIILNEKLIYDVERIQNHPPEEPEYRNQRTHKEFLTPIPVPLDEKLFSQSLYKKIRNYYIKNNLASKNLHLEKEDAKNLFESKHPYQVNNQKFLKKSIHLAYELMEKKYSNLDWIFKEFNLSESLSLERIE